MYDDARAAPTPPTSRRELERNDAESPTGFVVVRLAENYDPRPDDTLLRVASANGLHDLVEFLNNERLTESLRVVVTISPQQCRQLEAEAAHSDGLQPLRSLLQYWRVDARDRERQPSWVGLTALARRLRELPGVDFAYAEPGYLPAAVDPSNDPYSVNQSYLGPPFDPLHPAASGGVDARKLWSMGYDGAGVQLVDVEGGWFLTHEDLAPRAIKTIPGDVSDPSSGRHGTAVLGIVTGCDNAVGIVGIAPNLDAVTASCIFRAMPNVPFYADAITNAIMATRVGDVILLEMQTTEAGKHYPVESSDDVFDAIRLACALGRVVVEAAGNGDGDITGLDLDAYRNAVNVPVLVRGNRESGAIVVAASTPGPSYLPHAASNFGSRIDCFAPGDGVATCDYHTSGGGVVIPPRYRNDFSKTSAATAIVAGAAALAQSMVKTRTGNGLSPLALRALLSDPTINWPQGASPHHIGVMPNLGAVADAALTDIYLRDTTADTGVVPSTGVACASPDIIVRQVPVANPMASFGQGSGTEMNAALSDSVVAGADHVLYARLRNRGAAAAVGATVTFFWSTPSTLVTPDQWNLIGTTAPFDVPTGDVLVASGALAWPKAKNPGLGHYCFVAVANHPSDLAPPVPVGGFAAWADFLALVQNNNNVAWRNFDVVSLPSGSSARKAHAKSKMVLEFTVAGAYDTNRAFAIEILAKGVPAAGMTLRVPRPLAARFVEAHVSVDRFDEGECAYIDLKRDAGLRLRQLVLEHRARYECAIVLESPFGEVHGTPHIVVRQVYHGIEVGRITWQIRHSVGSPASLHEDS